MRLLKDVVVPQGQNYGSEYVNIWGQLARNPQYTALTSLFDQARIKGVRIDAVCTYNGGEG